MFSRTRIRSLRSPCLRPPSSIHARTIIAPPKPDSGPLMTRRADRALPPLPTSAFRRWSRTLPIFGVLMVASALAIFNYQKQSSPVVSSALYALRTSPEARRILGDEIYFAHQIPWISGELNQLHGRIDIAFEVKGTKGKARMRFKSLRKGRMGNFETTEWSLQPQGEEKVSLLAEGEDPFKQQAER